MPRARTYGLPLVPLPLMLAVALEPAESVVTVGVELKIGCGPITPVSPRGIVKLSCAADEVPEFVTLALDPAAPVVVEATATVAAVPVSPVSPFAP
jgi:hypothetical protein